MTPVLDPQLHTQALFPRARATDIYMVRLHLSPNKPSLPASWLHPGDSALAVTFQEPSPESTLPAAWIPGQPCDSSPYPHPVLSYHLFARTISYELLGLQNLPASNPSNTYSFHTDLLKHNSFTQHTLTDRCVR